MPYSNFKSIDDLVKKFGIAIQSGVSIFRQTPETPVSPELVNMLEDNVPLALNINTEKARSELIIAPILVEVWRALHHTVSLFSGIDFTVDESRDLAGFCDFLFSYSPDQAFLQIPVICIVEAKNENIKTGYAQCIAEMLAAQLFLRSQVLVARDAVIVPQQNGLEGRQQLHVKIEKVDRERHGERPCAHAEQLPREFRYLHRSPSFLTTRFRPAGPRSTGRAAPHA